MANRTSDSTKRPSYQGDAQTAEPGSRIAVASHQLDKPYTTFIHLIYRNCPNYIVRARMKAICSKSHRQHAMFATVSFLAFSAIGSSSDESDTRVIDVGDQPINHTLQVAIGIGTSVVLQGGPDHHQNTYEPLLTHWPIKPQNNKACSPPPWRGLK